MNRVAHFQWLGLWAVGVGSDVDSGSLLGPEVSSMFRSRHCLSRLHERRRTDSRMLHGLSGSSLNVIKTLLCLSPPALRMQRTFWWDTCAERRRHRFSQLLHSLSHLLWHLGGLGLHLSVWLF